jgi:hypothetical protein
MAERAAATSHAFELLGQLNEEVHTLAVYAADIEDERFSKLVHQLRNTVLSTGRQCGRIRRDLAAEVMDAIAARREEHA